MLTLDEILNGIKQLSDEDRAVVKAELPGRLPVMKGDLDTCLARQRFGETGFKCPHCGSVHIRRNGHTPEGRQRYICCSCGRTFGSRCRTVLAGTHKSAAVWDSYLECMFRGYSLRRSAKECGISLTAAFAWRHKILDSLRSCLSKVQLGGVVETDETYLAVSYKGNHSKGSFQMPRESRMRGHQVHQSGISKEEVCISCAISMDGKSAAAAVALGRADEKEMEGFFNGRLEEGTVLCTDHEPVFRAYCRKAGYRLVQAENQEKRERFLIQRINAYHSRLKQFLGPFRGVSTKYLDNYLAWNTLRDMGSLRGEEDTVPILREAFLTSAGTTMKEQRNRPAVPGAEAV